MCNKVVKSGIKVDLHIHSIKSLTKDDLSILKNSTIDNVENLVKKLNDNQIQLCAITDHDVFDFNLYNKLKRYEDDTTSSILKVLPGVEFSVVFNRKGIKKQVHVIAIFPDNDDVRVKNIENVLKVVNNHPEYDEKDGYSERKFIDLLSEINLDAILIVHQKQTLTSKANPKKNDANSLGNEVFNEFLTSEYFEAYEFKNKRNELFNNLSAKKYKGDVLRFITGSDCHDWNYYPKHDKDSKDEEFKFTYLKCLPTFKGLAFALTDYSRIQLDDCFFTNDSNNYIDSIQVEIENEKICIPLSRGINVIIGDNSIGKSLLLHKITNYYRKDEDTVTSSINSKLAERYDEYLENNKMKINSSIERSKIFEFDTQGEIRKKFNLKQIDGKGFYKGKFPPDVNVGEIKTVCNNILNEVISHLKKKFDYDDLLAKIHNIDLMKNNINASNLTFVDCENYFENDIISVNKITEQIVNVKKELNAFKELKISLDEKYNIEKIIKYIDKLNDKYKSEEKKLLRNIGLINIINSQFAEFNKMKQETDTSESLQLDAFIKRQNSFENNISDAFCRRVKYPTFDFEIEEVNLNPKEFPYLSYKFVKRTNITNVNSKYIYDLLDSPLKKGYSVKDLININKSKFKEMLKNYDEEKHDCIDFYKMKVTNKINSDFKSETAIVKMADESVLSYSDGINSQIYFDITCGDNYRNGIYLIDQPEDDVSPSAIKRYLLKDFKLMSKNRQIILVTHNPQFVVNLDVDNVVALTREDGKITLKSGALEYSDEDTNIIESVANILDGGIDSIKKRWKRYEKDDINR